MMKKTLLVAITFLLFFGVSFWKWPERANIPQTTNNLVSKQEIKNDLNNETFSQKEILNSKNNLEKINITQRIRNIFLTDQKNNSNLSWSCFTWARIVVRNQLSQKISEVSLKTTSLIDFASKLNYDTTKFLLLSKRIKTISLEIPQICTNDELQKNREQLRFVLNDYRSEINLFKQYINTLRKP